MAIRSVAAGGPWFSPKSTQHLVGGKEPDTHLSEYQRDVLRLMIHGETPQAIAQKLSRSINAIYSAQSQIREKLAVQTNEQAIVTAIQERIVPLLID
jgi:DNA-binding NarL/FixJ family response regulator